MPSFLCCFGDNGANDARRGVARLVDPIFEGAYSDVYTEDISTDANARIRELGDVIEYSPKAASFAGPALAMHAPKSAGHAKVCASARQSMFSSLVTPCAQTKPNLGTRLVQHKLGSFSPV
jgi:hypothetical protein